jgi:hypothetical protein
VLYFLNCGGPYITITGCKIGATTPFSIGTSNPPVAKSRKRGGSTRPTTVQPPTGTASSYPAGFTAVQPPTTTGPQQQPTAVQPPTGPAPTAAHQQQPKAASAWYPTSLAAAAAAAAASMMPQAPKKPKPAMTASSSHNALGTT